MIDSITITGRVPSKKNSRVTQKSTGRSFPSEDYQRWHKLAMQELMINRVQRNRISAKRITIRFVFGDHKVRDLTNKAESIMDLLVDYGYLFDDSWKHTGTVTLTGEYKAKHFITFVEVER